MFLWRNTRDGTEGSYIAYGFYGFSEAFPKESGADKAFFGQRVFAVRMEMA